MRLFLSCSLFFVLFFGFAYGYVSLERSADREKFSNHAKVISGDVWAFNEDNARVYLRLALTRDHYKTLRVREPQGREFVTLENKEIGYLDRLLEKFHLISTKQLETQIYHNDRDIGLLQGEQYVRTVYPLLYGGVVIFFVVLLGNLLAGLFHNRRDLARQVQERTRNLQESERRFHDLVNLLPEMVWETDRDGRVLYANQMAHMRLGMGNGTQYGGAWVSVILVEQRQSALHYFEEVVRGESQGLREFLAGPDNQSPFPVLVRSAPIFQDGTVTGARFVAVDITERHELEEQLRRAKQMKAIGLMAGGVAHDLNNILSGIVTYPELILMDLEQDNPLRPKIDAIRRSGLAAADVVSDLLTVARGVAAAREKKNINEIVAEYLSSPEYKQLQGQYNRIEFVLKLQEEAIYISCSAVHVRKCLMNLVLNGVEAIEGQGKIEIRSELRDLSTEEAMILSLRKGLYVVLAVTDTGPGINEKDQPHIFEPFYTKKVMGRSGTGLGLTVVYNTVTDHDGAVNLESSSAGSTFELLFPAEQSDSFIQEEEKCDWRALQGERERILVVDDEPQQREIAVKLLASLNYTVDAVRCGEEAVEYMRKKSADLLLLDMLMEPGINGRQTYEQILQIHPEQKAIIVSGFSESEDVRAALAEGAGAFISKPFTIAELGKTVYKELRK
ncbi:MAG: response regulator [Desulfopila sp.]|jgi:PAS domain S-box-containing protein|nr:response regulator [Desulfopila sp.]